MGWKRTLRSAAAAGRRAERAKNSRQNAEAKLLGRVDRSALQLIEKARALEERVAKDPIKALGLRFSPSHGFESEPFEVRTDFISGKLTLTPDAKIDRFKPCTYEIGDSKIEILDMLVLKWSTIVAFKVSHDDPTYRIRVNWVKKQDRTRSLVSIIDDDNRQNFFPLASDFSGDVLPGIPQTVLVAFEPFREMTGSIRVRIAGARFTAQEFYAELEFTCAAESLTTASAEAVVGKSLVEQVEESVASQVPKARKMAENARQSSGCLILLAALPLVSLGLKYLLS